MFFFLAEERTEDAATLAGLRSLFILLGRLGCFVSAAGRGAGSFSRDRGGSGGSSCSSGIERLLGLLGLGAGALRDNCSCDDGGFG